VSEQPEEVDKIKNLENKLNEAILNNSKLNDELKSVREELAWVSDQYNTLVNASFSELFDIAANIKNRALFKLLEARNKQTSKE
jgi:hypothetical protein